MFVISLLEQEVIKIKNRILIFINMYLTDLIMLAIYNFRLNYKILDNVIIKKE